MYQVFDYYNRPHNPIITLKNPSGRVLAILNDISNREVILRYNDISEFTFESFRYQDDGSVNDNYPLLQSRRLVGIENVGVFTITSVSCVGSGIFEKKSVTAHSLEKEMSRKNIGYLDGTYKFYDIAAPEGTLMAKIMELIPDWNLGHVDAKLITLYRTFTITSDQSLYNFMMQDVENAYQCIFKFNSFTRTIDVYAVENAIKKTDILLTYQNLIKQITVEENDDELATSLAVYGGGDLSIHRVNPLGNASMYDFAYYKRPEWMSQELIDSINKWEAKCELATGKHTEILAQLKEKNTELQDAKVKLKELETELNVLNQTLGMQVAGGVDTSETKSLITTKEAEIAAKKEEIKVIETAIENINKLMTENNSDLSFETNFTLDQRKELSHFTIQKTYTDDTFIVTDEMSDNDKNQVAQDLYDQAKKILKKLAQPRFSFDVDSVNFINMFEFKPFIDKLELGCEVRVDMGKDDLSAYPVLLEMSYSYDDKSKLDLKFSNRLRLDRDDYIFEELFGKTINISSTIEHESHNWGQGKDANSKVNELINSALDASKNKIISSTDQEVTMDSTGIRMKKLLPETQTYSPNEVWMTANTIGFTRDNWDTCSLALGEVTLGDKDYFGLVADAIVGRILIGEELFIENEKGSFRVTGDKVIIKDADLIITNSDGTESSLSDKTLEDIHNAIQGAIPDISDAIKDGIVDIFYQEEPPTTASEGDMWYDTSIVDGKPVNEAWVFRSGKWESLKDKDILDALDKAQSAQTTADGKIRTFYQTEPPVSTDKYKLGEGDLWFDINNGNLLHRYNASTYAWEEVRDGAIDSVSKDLADAITDLNQKIKDIDIAIRDGVIDTFYQDTEPNGSVGDLWFNTSNKKLYRHNGGTTGVVWELIEDASITDAIDKAQSAQDTADGKIRTFYQNDPPVSTSKYTLAEGDLWIDLNDSNKMYRWNNTSKAWISIRDLAIDEVSGNLADAITDINNKFANMEQAIADGVIETYYQDTMPTDGKIGDLWFNTSTGKLYRHNGKTTNSMADWDGVEDAGIIDAINKAQNAQDTADGKITTYYQNTEPLGTQDKPLGNGDLWFDLDDGNKPYRYDIEKKQWVTIQDKTIQALSKDLADAITDINGKFDNMNQALEDGIIETFYQDAMPTTATIGDLWFNTTSGKLYRHNGGTTGTISDWGTIEDPKIVEAIDKAQNAQDTADGKIRTFYNNEPPVSTDSYTLANGDLWIDTNDKNRPYRWDATAKRWIDIRDGSIADVSNDLNQAITDINNKFDDVNQAIADGVLETFYQSTDPCLDADKKPALGDLWFKTDTGKLYRHNGGTATKRSKKIPSPYVLKNIVSITQERDITIDVGGSYTLPTWAYATFSDTTQDWVKPIWKDTVNVNIAGTYMVYGTVAATGTYTNTSNIKATIRVIVKGMTPSNPKNIKSVAAQNDITIQKGGTYELPTWVLATLEDNTTSWVSTAWDTSKINVNVAGTYTSVGTFSPTGEVTNTNNLKASIRVIVNETTPTTKNIKSVTSQTDVTINKGGTYTLPNTVNVTLDDNSTRSLSVAWNTSGINVNVPNTYSVQGTLTLVSGITNTNNLKATVRVIVIDNTPQDLTITSVDSLSDVTIAVGYQINPPSQVNVRLSNGTSKKMSVVWDTSTVNNKVPATYTCKGQITLASGIKNPNNVQATIRVIVKDGISPVWDEITDKSIVDAIDKAQNAQDTADRKITTYYQNEPPTGTQERPLDNGDLWFDIDNGNKPHRYDKSQGKWISIQDGAIDDIAKDLANAIVDINGKFDDINAAIADGFITTYYQDTRPTDGSLGDLWYNTKTGKLYRHNGGTAGTMADWGVITDPDIIKAIEDAKNAQEVADGKITTYYQIVAPKNGDILNGKPIQLGEGDLWVSINEKNKLYRYTLEAAKAFEVARAYGSWDALSINRWSDLATKTWDNLFTGSQVGRWVPIRDGAIDDIENKLDSVLTPEGLLDTDKMYGQILAGKNNITCLNTAATKILRINEVGIIIASSKNGSEWNWSTAISADGINANVLQGSIIASEKMIIKNKANTFSVDESGVIIKNGSFTMDTGDGKGRIILDPSQGIKFQTKKVGQNEFADSFYVDTSGNLNFNGNLQGAKGTFSGTLSAGDIDINNKFKVDKSGNCTANSIAINGGRFKAGSIEGATISGGEINITSDIYVGRNIIMQGNGISSILQMQSDIAIVGYRGVVDIQAPSGLTVNGSPITSKAVFG